MSERRKMDGRMKVPHIYLFILLRCATPASPRLRRTLPEMKSSAPVLPVGLQTKIRPISGNEN